MLIIFKLLFKGTARRLVADALASGIRTGFNVGHQTSVMELRGKGIIAGCQVEEEVEEILKRAGF